VKGDIVRLLLEKNNIQKLFYIGMFGDFSKKDLIIWDERKDGLIPSNLVQFVGGLVRTGNLLEFNQAKWDAYQLWLANKTQTEAARKTRVEQAQTFIKNLDLSGSLTATQIQNAIKALVVLSRND
jgi:hypothetical protein